MGGAALRRGHYPPTAGFCYHQGAIWAGFTGPVLTYFGSTSFFMGHAGQAVP